MSDAAQRLIELEALIRRVEASTQWPALWPSDYPRIANVLRWFAETLRAVARPPEDRAAVVCAGCREPAPVARSRHLDGAARCVVCAVALLDARLDDLARQGATRAEIEIELRDGAIKLLRENT